MDVYNNFTVNKRFRIYENFLLQNWVVRYIFQKSTFCRIVDIESTPNIQHSFIKIIISLVIKKNYLFVIY